MRSVSFLLAFFLFCNLCFQCKKEVEAAYVCYEFDQRQCDTDPWAEAVPTNDSRNEREQKMSTYLENAGMDIKAVNITLEYHEFVCEACHSCPQGDRFYVQINKDDASKLEELELLNFANVRCSDFF